MGGLNGRITEREELTMTRKRDSSFTEMRKEVFMWMHMILRD